MAFDFNTLAHIGGTSPAPRMYTYLTTDLKSATLGANYFNKGFTKLKDKDMIFVSASDATFISTISSVVGNVVQAIEDPILAGSAGLSEMVIVTEAATLSGVLSSSKEYFIDGIIDMGSQSIEVPAGGLYLSGYNFDVSQLISTASSYTMFTSPVAGSGNLLFKDLGIDVSGTSSQVFNIKSNTGFEAVECARVNYNNCTSLGTMDNFRQGLEENTGRFGGSPSLTLKGVWVGGFRIKTSITRSMSDTTTEPLFKAGVGFTMASRFLTDMNVDLGTLQPLVDFAPANLINPSTFQLVDCLITRNGDSNPADTNICPNITNTDLQSSWLGNSGVFNSFVGGQNGISAGAATTISTVSTFVDIAGTWTASELAHFDSPANGQLRNNGNNPVEFRLLSSLTVEGPANAAVSVRVVIWDSVNSVFINKTPVERQINSLLGGRDLAFFAVLANLRLNQNDYVKLQIANDTNTSNLTVDAGGFYVVDVR